jgi:AcrR family transcriptional regulator
MCEWTDAFASRLAPTIGQGVGKYRARQETCGSEPAREGDLSGGHILAVQSFNSQAKLRAQTIKTQEQSPMNQEARFSRMEPELRKANLIEATLVCLKRHGFQGASIRKISAEAGVSVGLISHHYSGKDELVAEAYMAITGRVMTLLRDAMEQAAPTGRERLSAFFRASFCAELLDPQLIDAWLAFWGAVKTAEAINQAHEHSYGEYRAILGKVLRELAQEEGWEEGGEHFDADLAAISLSALLDGLWLESGLNPGTFTPEQGIQICEAWVDGLQAGGRQRFCVQTSSC